MVNDSDVRNSTDPSEPSHACDTGGTALSTQGAEVIIDDDSPQGTAKLVERLTERADLAERMRDSAWFQDHPDALFLAGVLAVIPSALARVRRAVRARRRRPRG